MFTCISCRVAFESAAEQRNHFATDWHRYNMKRRVANLPPVPAPAFNEKVLERREQNAVRIDPRDLFCGSCSKSFATENAYRSHMQSKKHREREMSQQRSQDAEAAPAPAEPSSSTQSQSAEKGKSRVEDEDDTPMGAESESEDEDEEEEIEQRLAAARRRIQPSDCLFCTSRSKTISDNVLHMARVHSFFIPDQEILIDLPGLLSYLGEKVVLANLCLFCPNGGREFGDLQAVRKHMIDKAHTKLAYEKDEDRAELADFYAFGGDGDDGSEWEEVDEDMDENDVEATGGITLAPDGLSLLLPSGRMLGHRSLKTYYDQRLRPVTATSSKEDAITAKVRQVRLNLADPTQALVPVAGGHGAFGRGLQVMKARNAGEAKWAKRQASSFKDIRARENHKTRIGYVHNNQKHFRDPLLQ